ncbi:aldo/keto reductase [Kribbella sp. VKM Ac-2566]|uniref:aldo/keto reductase n=1 Tax=Kribbella sp. VKM Ac-2566 TaxID=2512218 RepID=UPI001063F257|nr:aldo/keto reductase [Kribbella sp. VKM Ac-2566]TDX08333.1 aryl-alcohol dehydrogenase-like predicted oxidoreductase [Kribbella sp. VKM Ac-2566]
MDYRFVGRTGLEVSELCLGTWRFGEEADEPACHRMLDEFVDAGGTFIDTADVYGYSTSEEILGNWLKNRSRGDLVVATKVYGEAAPGRLVQGAGRKHILRAVDASLRRLHTDYIDLYQIHVFDDVTPFEETLSTLDGLVRSGKVRFVGASNYTGWQFQKSIDLARQHAWEPFVCLQPLYNLLDRDAEWELVPVCQQEGAGLIAYQPLAGGWLSGKYKRGMDGPLAGTRVEANGSWHSRATPETWSVIDEVLAIADEVDRTPAQVALRWLLQRPGVTAPIFGARTVDQLRDNLGATGWSLAPDQLDRLTEVSDRPLPYPYGTQALPQFRRRLRHPT